MRNLALLSTILLLAGCLLPEGSEDMVEFTADVAGTVWPPAKWIILGVFGVATATGAVKIKQGKKK